MKCLFLYRLECIIVCHERVGRCCNNLITFQIVGMNARSSTDNQTIEFGCSIEHPYFSQFLTPFSLKIVYHTYKMVDFLHLRNG